MARQKKVVKAKEPVFCGKCEFYLGDLGKNPKKMQCRHKENKVPKDTFLGRGWVQRSPKQLNNNNDCEWYMLKGSTKASGPKRVVPKPSGPVKTTFA